MATFEIITGKKYGQLTVLEQMPSMLNISKKGKLSCRAKWMCLCDCGELKEVRTSYLRNTKTPRCAKCSYALRPQTLNRMSALQRLYNLTVGRADKRGIDNNLNLNDFSNIIKQNCFYCGTAPRQIGFIGVGNKFAENDIIFANGVDRVNNNKGYETSNCVPCCKYCNVMKGTMSRQQFIDKCKKILYNLKVINRPKGHNQRRDNE